MQRGEDGFEGAPQVGWLRQQLWVVVAAAALWWAVPAALGNCCPLRLQLCSAGGRLVSHSTLPAAPARGGSGLPGH